VLIDSRETYERMMAFSGDYIATAVPKLSHYIGQRPLFDCMASKMKLNERFRAGSI
jgi:ribonuclease G